MNYKRIAGWLGLLIMIGTHIFVLMGNLTIELIPGHSWLNILGGLLIMWSCWDLLKF